MSSYDARPPRFRGASAEQWNDWHWQQQNRLRTLADFEGVLELTEPERRAFADAATKFRVAVTPHYAALMDASDPSCPLRVQAIPQPGELQRHSFELADPLAEEAHMPVPGLTHRYPDRALLYVTHNCPVYCRHCTRKRKVADPRSGASLGELDAAIEYIRSTPAVRDVIVSGGDPLSLSDERLDVVLTAIREVPHVEVVRVGTRNPVTLPQRVTDDLVAVFRRHRPIYLHTHFNHPRELQSDAEGALLRLLDAGCVLGNQMVLLRGVNDDADTVLALNRKLLCVGCRPYYMLQCDMAEGISHFRTPLETGLEIQAALRGRIGGMGIPQFVVDLPGGGGKVALTPDPRARREGETVVFRNWRGDEFPFVDFDPPR